MEELFNVEFELLGDIFRSFLLCTFLGLYLRFLIAFLFGEKWIKNYSQLLVFGFLPLTGYLITSVISNNIALSLGMVGALSIVRFRTPVKNPSELVIYFILITIGIVVNVNGNLAINFVIFLTLVILLIQIYKVLSEFFNLQEFNFTEVSTSYLRVNTNQENKKIENLNQLKHKSYDGTYLYVFSDKDKSQLQEIEQSFDKDQIISISFDFEE